MLHFSATVDSAPPQTRQILLPGRPPKPVSLQGEGSGRGLRAAQVGASKEAGWRVVGGAGQLRRWWRGGFKSRGKEILREALPVQSPAIRLPTALYLGIRDGERGREGERVRRTESQTSAAPPQSSDCHKNTGFSSESVGKTGSQLKVSWLQLTAATPEAQILFGSVPVIQRSPSKDLRRHYSLTQDSSMIL